MNKKTIRCRSCGRQVSASARHCPRCGTVLKMPASGIFVLIFLAFIIIGFAIVIIFKL
ncbi:MAG: zinc-ribbon domain-containing protein [Candidatus Cloacimonetes bacterium]|nr:zinc-ribbon domain-containing protein [Candidatus Cloacimonadota bacterium]